MDISSEMVYPLVPIFLTSVLGATKTTVGIIEGLAESTASILKVFSGYFSDVLGKRKLLMTAGYAISAISRPILWAAGTPVEVLMARFVDRTGKGVRTAPRDALIAASVNTEGLGRAFGFHRMMDTVGAVIGPVVATVLLALFIGNLRLVFIASTVPAIIAVLLIVAFIKERPLGARSREWTPLASFNGEFRSYMIAITVFSLGTVSDAFLILKAESVGVQKTLIPLLYLLFNIVYALTAVPLGALADRIGLRTMVLMSFFLYSIVMAWAGFAGGGVEIWALFLFYGLYKGLSDSTQRAYLARIVPASRLGTGYGVFHTAAGAALLPASIVGGALWDSFGPQATFLYAAGMAAVAAIVFMKGRGSTASG
jgi:MFS family permease